ncbi:hypothetical protein BDY19DRAFT_882013 [Irpex rosettiformis]|uniref:Uncharacterized protein n=1 Tax=Irpex rosettiformis TaxID=378272 RepID=A0ACB8UH52_9APHY|nr:hypothetical protein BDY19DRAFT_882013 [Irpex rosettiformis]
MPAKRALKIPPPNTSPRDSLPPSDHATVDTVLKELKQSTRRLQDALELHHVELQVLEKLYYKGNNQHRTALFWRRVLDIRRFARRLEGADLYGLMDGVRVSFWGDETQRNPRILKGSWTCYPDAKTVQTVLRRLIDCHTLVQHMHEHVSKAHNHFNLEFQGGAFLQLILTLTAISSRIGMLLTEVIQPAIEQAGQVLYKLLFFVLHVSGQLVNTTLH